MSETIPVAVAFRVDPEILERIKETDPRIEIIDLPGISGRGADGADEASRAEWREQIARAEVLFGPSGVPGAYLDAATNLKWYQVINAGVDRLAKDGYLSRGFTVTNVSGMTAPAIAEYVIGSIVMLAKGIHHSMRAQAEHRWDFRFTPELTGRTIAIAGMGAIGRETARRARAFGMRIIASRRTVSSGDTDPDCDQLFAYSDLPALLAEADFLVLCVPLTPETHHMIGAAELQQMKPSAFLVNIARGQVIDQEALVEALGAETIAGAALDVFDPEPLPPDHPLWDLPNVIITPHISGAIEGYGHRAAEMFLENLARYTSGQPLRNVCKPDLGY